MSRQELHCIHWQFQFVNILTRLREKQKPPGRTDFESPENVFSFETVKPASQRIEYKLFSRYRHK